MRSNVRQGLALLAAVAALATAFIAARPAYARRLVRQGVRLLSAAEMRPAPAIRLARAFEANATDQPDVLLVLIDTLRADHLGAYGYGRPTSPFIDSLARDGAVFENTFSQAPWTLPAVLSLMMSRYPSDLGLGSPSPQASVLPAEGPTLAERFRSAGYRTLALSDHPAINAVGFGRGFEVFDSLPSGALGTWGWAETESGTILKRWRALIARTDDRPTFAYAHLYYPHAPYEPPPPFDTLFGWGSLLTRARFRGGVINLYDGEIRRADALLSEMVPQFAAGNPRSGTPITAIISDHGEAFWDHGILGHEETLYNELLHVPFILHAPGRVGPGRRVADLTQTVDIGPTLLDLAGVPDRGETEPRGRSRSGIATDDAGSRPDADWILSESPVRGSQTRAIQTRSLKVIQSPTGPIVFRLSVDRGETHPLRLDDVPEAQGISVVLAGVRPRRATGAATDHEGLERMRAIGYLLPPAASPSPTKDPR